MKQYSSFAEAIKATKFELYQHSELVAPRTWQSVDVSKMPEMATHEISWWGFKVNVGTYVNARDYLHVPKLQEDIAPNLPWSDDHFEERVSGYPLNPGTQWAKWPYGHSADKFRDRNGMFNHTYAERYWPKFIATHLASTTTEEAKINAEKTEHWSGHTAGIRHDYGDLNDVVQQLVKDPATRQAILPVFFPEDTGAVHGDRVPCSIHYQFMVRNGRLDIFYYLRSCDFIRHFRDDIYLTVRLQLWMIDRLKENGIDVTPGMFLMQTGSLHLFRNDWAALFNEPYTRS
jgi:thymidylate synthase